MSRITKHDNATDFGVVQLEDGRWAVCAAPVVGQPAGLIAPHPTQGEAEEAYSFYIREL